MDINDHYALFYNIYNELKNNAILSTQLHEQSLKLYDQSIKINHEINNKKITDTIGDFCKKRKIDETEFNNNENIYKVIKYDLTELSYNKKKITNIFHKLSDIKSIINLKSLWYEIRHDIRLQKLYNIIPPLEELDAMIGLDNIKKELFKIIIYYIQNEHKDEYLHTIIEGPPGVGKTQFAKIYANIFVRLGILKKDTFIEIKKNDLVAKYLGQTSHQTKKLLDNAMGGVIFLDEAYSIGNEEKRDSFAKEAIDMINQYLSEKKSEFMFIIAGYKNDLESCFFSFNKGLKRRFAHSFEIKDYNDKELADIFKSKIKSLGYKLDDNIDIYNFFKKNYSNFKYFGGDIEKLINNIKYEQSLRTFKNNNYNKIITIEDIDNSLIKNEKEESKVPFGMYL